MSAQDNDETIPTAENIWSEIGVSGKVLQCPTAGKSVANAYGYSQGASGISMGEAGDSVNMIITTDASEGSKNILKFGDDCDGRHDGGVIASYLDGHVAFLKTPPAVFLAGDISLLQGIDGTLKHGDGVPGKYTYNRLAKKQWPWQSDPGWDNITDNTADRKAGFNLDSPVGYSGGNYLGIGSAGSDGWQQIVECVFDTPLDPTEYWIISADLVIYNYSSDGKIGWPGVGNYGNQTITIQDEDGVVISRINYCSFADYGDGVVGLSFNNNELAVGDNKPATGDWVAVNSNKYTLSYQPMRFAGRVDGDRIYIMYGDLSFSAVPTYAPTTKAMHPKKITVQYSTHNGGMQFIGLGNLKYTVK